MITVYGIRQCDRCRKTLKELERDDVTHRFHDLRVDGLEADRLRTWLASDFADRLVNRRSTTWRGLSEAEKASDGEALVDLLLAHPTLVKRPLIEEDGALVSVG